MPPKKPTSPDTTRKIDDRLDDALKDSFPASDPISFIEPSTGQQAANTRRSKTRGQNGGPRKGTPRSA